MGNNSRENIKVFLRELRKEDSEMIYEWRNSDFVKQFGTQQKSVSKEEHTSWIDKACSNSSDLFVFIAEVNSIPFGQISFKKLESKIYVVSLYLIENYIGKGLGSKVLSLGISKLCEYIPDFEKIIAFVRKDNLISQKTFERCFFERVINENITRIPDNHLVYEYVKNEISLSIPHNKLTFDETEIKEVTNVIQSGFWAGKYKVLEVEKRLSDLTDRKYAILVSSGLSAIRLALLAVGVKENDEVLLPAYSCVAIPNAILALRAIPTAVDIDLTNYNISQVEVGKKSSLKTKYVLGVHTFGNPLSLKALEKTITIEDCSHGFLKSNMGKLADIAVMSFYATKFIGGGEGGAILTDNSHIADFLYDWRDYTDKQMSGQRLNDKISDIEAAIIKVQLSKIEHFIQKRQNIADFYFELLEKLTSNFDFFTLPEYGSEKVWYRFVVRLSRAKNKFMELMQKLNISVVEPVHNWIDDIQNYPNASMAYQQAVSLPIYPSLTPKEQKFICKSIINILNQISYEDT